MFQAGCSGFNRCISHIIIILLITLRDLKSERHGYTLLHISHLPHYLLLHTMIFLINSRISHRFNIIYHVEFIISMTEIANHILFVLSDYPYNLILKSRCLDSASISRIRKIFHTHILTEIISTPFIIITSDTRYRLFLYIFPQ